MRFEDFKYNGAAILKGGTRPIEGIVALSGHLGWEATDSSDHALADSVSLKGIFTANAPIPPDFARLSYNIRNGCTLTLLEEGGKGLSCTIKRMEGERSVEIVRAGY